MGYKRNFSKFKSSFEGVGEFSVEDSGKKPDGGVNLQDLPSEIEPEQAQDMRNIWYDGGALRTRPGQREFIRVTGDGIDCVINDNLGHILLQCSSKLYRYSFNDGSVEELISLTVPDGEDTAPKGSFFLYGYSVFFLNGIDYIRIDGSSAYHVEGYIPTVYHITQGYDPNNYMKTPYEEINMLSDYYYLLFDTYSDYKRHLIPKVLCPSSSLIKSIIINGVEYASSKYSISDYSSNYFSVNLSNYPPAAERYLRVKLKRTANNEFGLPELKDRIKYTCAIAYGGDSRVFFCGDGTNKYRYSVSYDPSYLPNSFTRAVGNGDELLCFGRQYDILTMFKKYETHVLSYNYSNGSVEFEARCISPVIGCDIKGSVRTIQNRLVFANTYGGAYILVSTARENEKNVQPISYNVDKLLRPALCEADAVSSADHNGRYWLQAGEYTFVWDYSGSPYTYSGGTVSSERKLAWYIFDNISGELFCVGNELYCARSDAPMVSVFEDRADDFGEPIKSYWHSAEMKLGKVNDFKVVEKLWLTLPPGVKSEMNAEYVFTEADRCVRVNEPKVISSGGEADFLKVFECSPNRHRVRAFSVRLSCNSSDAVLALCSMRVKYRKERY